MKKSKDILYNQELFDSIYYIKKWRDVGFDNNIIIKKFEDIEFDLCIVFYLSYGLLYFNK